MNLNNLTLSNYNYFGSWREFALPGYQSLLRIRYSGSILGFIYLFQRRRLAPAKVTQPASSQQPPADDFPGSQFPAKTSVKTAKMSTKKY